VTQFLSLEQKVETLREEVSELKGLHGRPPILPPPVFSTLHTVRRQRGDLDQALAHQPGLLARTSGLTTQRWHALLPRLASAGKPRYDFSGLVLHSAADHTE
jgi:hypothetical protein